MPRASLSQFLTALATNADLFAAFINDPLQLAGFYLSPADRDALFSGDSATLFQSLYATPMPMTQPQGRPAPATPDPAESTGMAVTSSAILGSTFEFCDQWSSVDDLR